MVSRCSLLVMPNKAKLKRTDRACLSSSLPSGKMLHFSPNPAFGVTQLNPYTPSQPLYTAVLFVCLRRFGTLGDIYCPRDLRTGEPRGFAFVRFMDQRDADDAIDRMDGEFFAGRELRIQVGWWVGWPFRVASSLGFVSSFAPRSCLSFHARVWRPTRHSKWKQKPRSIFARYVFGKVLLLLAYLGLRLALLSSS